MERFEISVIVGMAMSLNGYVADAYGDVTPLYPALVQGSMQENDIIRESIESTGAVVMGRSAYEMAEGDFTGYEYQVPIFVLTHHPPGEEPRGQSDAGSTIEFVNDGLVRAIEKVETATGDRDVTVVVG